jgi:hypothetical protein
MRSPQFSFEKKNGLPGQTGHKPDNGGIWKQAPCSGVAGNQPQNNNQRDRHTDQVEQARAHGSPSYRRFAGIMVESV